MCMVCLEYVEVSGSQAQGGTNTPFLGSVPTWTCVLREWRDEWETPINLTCAGGTLQQPQ